MFNSIIFFLYNVYTWLALKWQSAKETNIAMLQQILPVLICLQDHWILAPMNPSFDEVKNSLSSTSAGKIKIEKLLYEVIEGTIYAKLKAFLIEVRKSCKICAKLEAAQGSFDFDHALTYPYLHLILSFLAFHCQIFLKLFFSFTS